MKPRMSKMARREALAFYLGVSPWIIGFLLFTLIPLVMSLGLSFTNYSIMSPPKFVGLQNFVELVSEDQLVPQSLKVTALYSLVTVPLGVAASLLLAMLLNQAVKGLAFFRAAMYVPAVVPVVASAYLFVWLFNPNVGIVNSLLHLFGLQGPAWLLDPVWALPTLMILSLWGVGGNMVLYLAALQGVPTDLYDAAMVDGAGAWRKFWNVTVPMISPVILFTTITGVISAFQAFVSAWLMTQGGPVNSTLFFMIVIYRNGFQYFKMGYAAALAWILALIILGLSLLLLRTAGRLVYYEAEGGSLI
jgi:multiple sugar transport system permease protein